MIPRVSIMYIILSFSIILYIVLSCSLYMNYSFFGNTVPVIFFTETVRSSVSEKLLYPKAPSAYVSRGTFYKYFSDKHELMHLYYQTFMDQNIMANYDGHNWESVLEILVAFVEDKKDYFRNVNKTEGQDSFWDFLWQYSFDFYKSIKLRNEKREELPVFVTLVLFIYFVYVSLV